MTATGVAPDRDRLAELLREAGSALDPDGVAELIAGVLAAPPEIGTSWHALVADPTPPALAEALEQYRAWLAEDWRDGLAPEDFARLPRPARLALLREELAARGLDGFVVPRSDEHQGEYVPACAQRLAWLTGFTGSAGIAIVLKDRAALFVDGRYTLQAAAQVDPALFEIRHVIEEPPAQWLGSALGQGAVLGYDPWLHTPHEVERLRAGAERAGRACARGPYRTATRWTGSGRGGRPRRSRRSCRIPTASPARAPPTSAPAWPARLAEDGVAAAVLTMPESIAWLLNIRGGDVPHTPLPLSFAILRDDGGVRLFIDRRKLAPGLDRHLGNAVSIEPVGPFRPGPRRAGRSRARACRPIRRRPRRGCSTGSTAAGGTIHRAADPCLLPKACKNPVELDGTRAAHRRDGAAVTRFLAWLAREAPKGGLREIAASDRLEAFRRDGEYFRDLSFPTISGAGSNGAIVHYRATPGNRKRPRTGDAVSCSIRARNISTARPTSRARSRSARRAPKCATASRAC